MSHRVHIEWDQYIRLVEGYINNVPNVITLQTPKYIMTGVKAERPWEEEGNSYIQDLKKVKENLTKYWRRQNERMNRKIRMKVKFEVGDLVLVRNVRNLQIARGTKDICAKLVLPYKGPYIVKNIIGNNYEPKAFSINTLVPDSFLLKFCSLLFRLPEFLYGVNRYSLRGYALSPSMC
ncbi:hypothetical protein QE152_g31159 [Popillia japonica]|uniref:Uncharacterized protein n=1 Tax=Popillia japonica TaxID=7064 RepID=A0AAW1JBU8_POPJA